MALYTRSMYWILAPQTVNRTWLVGMWCVGALAGIALVKAGLLLNSPVFLLTGLVLFIPAFKRSRIALGLIILSGLLVGGWQGTRAELELRSLNSYIGQNVELSGTIFNDPSLGRRQDQQFYITDITINNTNVAGKVAASTLSDVTLQRGDTITLNGKLTPGFGNYQARLGFARVVTLYRGDQPVLQVRDAFAAGIHQAIPDPQASLGLGFLLGQRNSLPDELDENLRLVGLTHIVVASGYNLTILVRAARRLLAGISKFQAFIGSMSLVGMFVVMTGFSPSMTRAAFVTTLSLLAWYYGRRIYPLVLILFAAAVTALINPLYVWSDIGWYLSFLAFIGVLMIAPLLTNRLYGEKRPSLVAQVALESIAAQIMVIPLLLWLFGELSVLALVANILVVPLIPLTMLLTFGAGCLTIALPALAAVFGLPATIFISYMISVTNWLATVPWAMHEMSINLIVMICLYAIIIALGFMLWRRTHYDFLHSSVTD